MQASAAVNGANGTVTISGDSKIESALGGGLSAGIGGGAVGNGTVSISGNATIENAQGGKDGAGIGGGYGYGQSGTGDITIEGNTTVNATGGMGSAGIGNGTDAGGNNGQITIRGTKDSSPTVNATGGIAEEDGQGYVGPGGAGIGGGSTTDSEYTLSPPRSPLRQSDHRCQGGREQRGYRRHERRAGLHRPRRLHHPLRL